MGCSICLDGYDESNEQDKSRRPVALLCGHIFHKDCSDNWLKICKLHDDPATCPICKREQGATKALQLWPGDVRDIDAYLAHRNRRINHQTTAKEGRPAPATVALDRYMSREKQGELLGHLMDFQQHINAYVMSVNNVSMSTRGGDSRIYRLFADVRSTDPEKQQEFESSMSALSRATGLFNETLESLEQLRQESETMHRRTKQDYERVAVMKQTWEQHMETREKEIKNMHAERSRVKRLEMHLKLELQKVEQSKESLERERKSILAEAREKEHNAMKAQLESSHLIAQTEGHAKGEIERMKKYVMEQEKLRVEAENRAREIQDKNNTIADRLKLLSEKLDQSRREVKKLKGKRVVPSVKTEDVLLEPQVASQLDDDGFVEVGSKVRRPSIKRSRLSIEQEDGIVVLDDDGDDFGDTNYPMPGFLVQSSSRRAPETDGDSSVEYVETRTPQRRGLLASNDTYMQRATSGPFLALGARTRRR